MTMNYLSYVMVIGLASLSVAAVTCVGIWLMAPMLSARLRLNGGVPEPGGPPAAPAPSARRGFSFDFSPEQAPAVAAMLANESDEDLSTVAAFLPPPTALALLSVLDPDRRARVLACLAEPRSVDMELLRGMKDEIEGRLYGSFGGAEQAASLIRPMSLQERKSLLPELAARSPGAGGLVREMFVLPEDLDAMSAKDVRALAGAVKPESMGRFLPALPEKLRSAIKAEYKAKAAQALEKAVPKTFRAGEKEESLAAFIDIVEKLAAKGVIARPRVKPAAPAAGTASAAAAPEKDDWG